MCFFLKWKAVSPLKREKADEPLEWRALGEKKLITTLHEFDHAVNTDLDIKQQTFFPISFLGCVHCDKIASACWDILRSINWKEPNQVWSADNRYHNSIPFRNYYTRNVSLRHFLFTEKERRLPCLQLYYEMVNRSSNYHADFAKKSFAAKCWVRFANAVGSFQKPNNAARIRKKRSGAHSRTANTENKFSPCWENTQARIRFAPAFYSLLSYFFKETQHRVSAWLIQTLILFALRWKIKPRRRNPAVVNLNRTLLVGHILE